MTCDVRLLAGALLALAVSVCCSGEREASAERKPVTVWRTVATWTGRAPLQTESFISNTGLFRVHWEARPLQPPDNNGTLRVTLHSAVSGRPLVEAVDHRGPGRDTVFLSEDPREFFLVIDDQGLDWTVTLDEGFPATAPAPLRN